LQESALELAISKVKEKLMFLGRIQLSAGKEEFLISFHAKIHGYSGRFNGGYTEIFENPSKS
jgi:hypothetical protein